MFIAGPTQGEICVGCRRRSVRRPSCDHIIERTRHCTASGSHRQSTRHPSLRDIDSPSALAQRFVQVHMLHGCRAAFYCSGHILVLFIFVLTGSVWRLKLFERT